MVWNFLKQQIKLVFPFKASVCIFLALNVVSVKPENSCSFVPLSFNSKRTILVSTPRVQTLLAWHIRLAIMVSVHVWGKNKERKAEQFCFSINNSQLQTWNAEMKCSHHTSHVFHFVFSCSDMSVHRDANPPLALKTLQDFLMTVCRRRKARVYLRVELEIRLGRPSRSVCVSSLHLACVRCEQILDGKRSLSKLERFVLSQKWVCSHFNTKMWRYKNRARFF